jgi:GntR family transcriptional regulator/MocR family aminotransferase
LVQPLRNVRLVTEGILPWDNAMTLARFMSHGDFEGHLLRLRRLYRERRDTLTAALLPRLDASIQLGPCAAGSEMAVLLPPGTDDLAVVNRAAQQGLAVAALSNFYLHDARPGLVLGFGALPADEVNGAASLLARVLEEAVYSPTSRERGADLGVA